MIKLVRGELLKVRTTRSFVGLTIGAALFSVLGVIAVIITGGGGGFGGGVAGLITPRGFARLGSNAYIFAGVLGVLIMTGEARHATADHTFLVAPRRTKVVLSKGIAALIAGSAMGFLVELFIFAVGLPLLSSRGVSYSFEVSVLGDVVMQLLGIGLMAVFGMVVGALVRNQIAGIILVAAWLFIGENLLFGLLLPDLGRFGVVNAFGSIVGGGPFRIWAAFLLLAYLLILGGAGTALLERRDIT